MEWPRDPVELREEFRPPYCPRRDCTDHRRTDPAGYRWTRIGHYWTACAGVVQRYRCGTCGRSFSQRAFATGYWMKRPELLVPIAAGLQAGSAHRQIARSLGCAPSTVTRASARLGRHAMLLHTLCLRHLERTLIEEILLDHFETFELTQDLPLGIGTLTGRDSWFLYAIDPAPHRRTGRRSPHQQARLLRRPPRPTRGGYLGSTGRLFDVLDPLLADGCRLRLIHDGMPDYVFALAGHPLGRRTAVKIHPNPERGPKGSPRSAAARARDRAMSLNDYLHLFLRHTCAHHRRETIAFGRCGASLMGRMYLTVVWRNLVKGRSERRPDHTSPAMHAGLTERPWDWRRVLARRLFPGRVGLPGILGALYGREWTTPGLPRTTRHALRLAY